MPGKTLLIGCLLGIAVGLPGRIAPLPRHLVWLLRLLIRLLHLLRSCIPRSAIAALPRRLLGIGLLGVALGRIRRLLPVALLSIALGIALALGRGALGLRARIALPGGLIAHPRLITILWTAVIHPYTLTFPPPGRRHILIHAAASAEKKRR